MKIEIENTINGYIIKELDDERIYVYEDIVDLLCHVLDIYDSSSRYADNRVYVIKAPGDKNDKFTNKHSDVIFGEFNE